MPQTSLKSHAPLKPPPQASRSAINTATTIYTHRSPRWPSSMPTIKSHLPDRHRARGRVSALERQLHYAGRKIADFIRDPASPSPGVVGLVRFRPQMCVDCCVRAAKHPTPVPGQLAQDYSGLFQDNLSTVYIILMICLRGFLGNPPFNSPSFRLQT